MKSKVFYEENRTIVICLTNDDNVVIEIFDYSSKQEKYSVDFRYYDYDFEMVLDIYKHFDLI